MWGYWGEGVEQTLHPWVQKEAARHPTLWWNQLCGWESSSPSSSASAAARQRQVRKFKVSSSCADAASIYFKMWWWGSHIEAVLLKKGQRKRAMLSMRKRTKLTWLTLTWVIQQYPSGKYEKFAHICFLSWFVEWMKKETELVLRNHGPKCCLRQRAENMKCGRSNEVPVTIFKLMLKTGRTVTFPSRFKL